MISRDELDLDLRAMLVGIQLEFQSIPKKVGARKKSLRVLVVTPGDENGGFVFLKSVKVNGYAGGGMAAA